MTTKEVKIGSGKYQVSTIDSVFQQFEVARTLGSVLAGLAAMKKADVDGRMTPEVFAQAFCALCVDAAKDDVDRATEICLSAVRREQVDGAVWSPISVIGTRKLMFDDIDLPTMLQLVWHVLEVNRLPDFFSVRPPASEGAPAT